MLYLDLLPDDILQIIYRYVNDRAITQAIKRAKRRQIPCKGKQTNDHVVYSWMNSRPWRSLRMRTDGKDIYSYALKIGYTNDDKDEKVLLDYTAGALGYYSQTTSTHVNKARPYADTVIYEN